MSISKQGHNRALYHYNIRLLLASLLLFSYFTAPAFFIIFLLLLSSPVPSAFMSTRFIRTYSNMACHEGSSCKIVCLVPSDWAVIGNDSLPIQFYSLVQNWIHDFFLYTMRTVFRYCWQTNFSFLLTVPLLSKQRVKKSF